MLKLHYFDLSHRFVNDKSYKWSLSINNFEARMGRNAESATVEAQKAGCDTGCDSYCMPV